MTLPDLSDHLYHSDKGNRPLVIGIAGPDGVGKDTLGLALHKHFSADKWPAQIFHFSDPLYASVSAMCSVPISEIHERKNDIFTESTAPARCLIGKSFRYLLRVVGTEFGRQIIHTDLWVDLMKAKIARLPVTAVARRTVVLIPDLRFPNEAPVCDVIIELSRQGVHYSPEHESSAGLPPQIKRTVVVDLSAHDYTTAPSIPRALFPL